MESTAPTTAPAPSAPPAPPPAAAPSAPAATPSTPSQVTPYGKLNPSVTQSIFDQLDTEGGAQAAAPEPEAIPVAKVPGTEMEPEAAVPQEVAPAGEDTLPQNIREALKVIPDKRLQNVLADAYHMTRDLRATGHPVATIRQFIQDAPKYLAVAPNVDVLEHMAQTASTANELGAGYTEGTIGGFQNFTGALLRSNPKSFVGYADFLLRNTETIRNGLAQHYGADVANAYVKATDGFRDDGNRNVIANMRRLAAEAEKNGKPDDEVWAEVADKMEEFLKLGPNDAPKNVRPDPRDQRIQELEAEKERVRATQVEQFKDGVYNQAGHQIQSALEAFLTPRIKGYPDEAQKDIREIVGQKLYQELLNNKHIQARARAIEQNGRYDKDHFQALTNFYIDVGKRLLGNVALPVLEKYSKITAPRRAQEQERLARHTQRRDPGASGGPPSAPAFKSIASLSQPKDIFDLLDAQAGDNG